MAAQRMNLKCVCGEFVTVANRYRGEYQPVCDPTNLQAFFRQHVTCGDACGSLDNYELEYAGNVVKPAEWGDTWE